MLDELTSSTGAKDRGVSWLAENLGRSPNGVTSDLSKGFASGQLALLRGLFEARGQEFNDHLWSLDVEAERDRLMMPVEGVRLSDQLFLDVRTFLCIRAPSPHPRIPERKSPPVDERGLVSALAVAEHAPSFAYIGEIWGRVLKRRAEGKMIISVGRIAALVETWAATMLIRNKHLQNKVGIYLIPSSEHPLFSSNGRGHYFPMMGARVINGRRCLLSTPVPSHYSSRSPIIESSMMAALIEKHAEDLISISRNLTGQHLETQLEEDMRREFDALVKSGSDVNTQYGLIDEFEKVKVMALRLRDFADAGKWYPPLA
ncbi:MAG: hypothetical protein WDN24_20310 [Sphingomonas sp.]